MLRIKSDIGVFTSVLLYFSYEEYFRQIFGLSGSKKIVENIPRNIIWEIWEASCGSEIFFSLFDGGM